METRHIKNPLFAKSVLFLLVAAGIVIDLKLNWDPLLAWTEGLAHTWWLAPALVVFQALAFAFAMSGSIMFVVIGLLYDPMPATAIITSGGVIGSVLAYHFSKKSATPGSVSSGNTPCTVFCSSTPSFSCSAPLGSSIPSRSR